MKALKKNTLCVYLAWSLLELNSIWDKFVAYLGNHEISFEKLGPQIKRALRMKQMWTLFQ